MSKSQTERFRAINRRVVWVSISIIMLCAATYLARVPMWRYEAIEVISLPKTANEIGSHEWAYQSGEVLFDQDGAAAICLGPRDEGEDAKFAIVYAIPGRFDHIALEASIMAEGLILDQSARESAAILLLSFNDRRQWLKFWPRVLAWLDEDHTWEDQRLVIPADGQVKYAQFIAYNEAASGIFCMREARIIGLEEKTLFQYVGLALLIIWVILISYLLLSILRATPARWRRTAVLFVFILLGGLALLPQPYYANFVGPLQTLIDGQLPSPVVDQENEAIEPSENGTRGVTPRLEQTPYSSDDDTRPEAELESAGWAAAIIDWLRRNVGFSDFTHGGAFFVLGLLAGRFYGFLTPLALLLALGSAILATEALQLFVVTRDSELRDLIANSLGGMVGYLTACLLNLGRRYR